ncbi:hypothetical protein SAMN05880582_105238 [Rhizobium sp. RU20A]|uniref:hypothetical protein n=1 Tax=Rhizobium sp. RU20A TaxID=1907412 RepID=UPI0009540F1C|nr:hypothetical protein [Rhizobium sp. RU20A]SIR02004.1 hypothetical protein SAMN05880582_105238 [Rhizobium sp. RU20A]
MLKTSAIAILAALTVTIGAAGPSHAFQIGSFARQLGTAVAASGAPLAMNLERSSFSGACETLAYRSAARAPQLAILIPAAKATVSAQAVARGEGAVVWSFDVAAGQPFVVASADDIGLIQ